jgi:two-component system response regulator AtoC
LLRVIAATNRDIVESVRSGAFREDLYHRLAVFTLELPPLAARREDIAPLAETFVTYFASRIKTRIRGLSRDALTRLTAYHYPGNVRELRNIIERAVILAEGEEITERDIMLPAAATGDAGGPPFFGIAPLADGTPPPLDDVERLYVERVLGHFEGKRMAAAEALGISYPTFLKRLRELGMD